MKAAPATDSHPTNSANRARPSGENVAAPDPVAAVAPGAACAAGASTTSGGATTAGARPAHARAGTAGPVEAMATGIGGTYAPGAAYAGVGAGPRPGRGM